MDYDDFKKYLKYALGACAVLFVLAWWFKDDLPSSSGIDFALQSEPVQKKVDMEPFDVTKGGKTYTIEPLFEYDLHGLVVSYHHSESWLDFAHKAWGDYLNVKDLCVVWGSNVNKNLHNKLSYSSGDWTCYFSTNSTEAWSAFDKRKISNNHLLARDGAITKKIMEAKNGDQVRFKGYLVNYYYGKGGGRGTSTSRDDTGQGACETVFVEQFTIIKRANAVWWLLYEKLPYVMGILLLTQIWVLWKDITNRELRDEIYYHGKGMELLYKGNYKKAVDNFTKAIHIDPEMVEAYQDRGHAREALGDHAGAQEDLDTAERMGARIGMEHE